ncbi:MAG: hypothetical protein HFH38_12230 [Lachnospiraceae bacterium]|jgi:hypothetical protein|nr:hypothetical protein [Lachnospiraceae bacterium]
MSAFHRMVTYLHLYEHNTKGRNTGFAKIAKKGNTCLVEIHMKNTGYSISPIPVYFYAQKEQGFQGILLGNMSLVRGNGDFKAALEERDLSGSGYTLEDIKGIFLPVSDETMFVSQWDNDPFVRERFTPLPLPEDTGEKPDGEQILPHASPTSGNSMAAENPNQPIHTDPLEASRLTAAHTHAENPAAEAPSASAFPMQSDASTDAAPQTSHGMAVPSQANTDSPTDDGNDISQNPASAEPSHGSHTPQANAGPSHGSHTPQANAEPPSPAKAPPAADGTKNTLEATEALPKRSRTSYRNPFALPRFMPPWQQEAIQRQRSKNKGASAPPPAGKQTPEPSAPQAPPAEEWAVKWQFILEHYPVMTPFAGDETTLCVRLDLKDIRLLPKKYWYLGNNSFLLHGFFNYRYLILGMAEKSGSKKWFLGIPGVFQNPERVMATLFGFPGFRNEKSAPINTGEFGYWFRYLDE